MSYETLTLQIPVSVCEIVSVHYFEYLSDFSFPGESHDFWELVYVDKGEFEAVAGKEIIPMKKKSIIFHKPNEFHNVLTNGKVSPSLVVISFVCHSPCMEAFQNQVLSLVEQEQALLARIIIEARHCFEGRLDDPYQESLIRMENPFTFAGEELIRHYLEQALLARIIIEARHCFEGRLDDPYQESLIRMENPFTFAGEELIRHYLEELIILLYRRFFFKPLPISFKQSFKPTGHKEVYSRIVLYMEANLDKSLTVKEICEANLISPPYLQKIFREIHNCGAIDFFLHMKLDAAKQMIRDQQLNFTQIADRLGYSSIHYFSKQFKRFNGMSPSEYASSLKQMAERPEQASRRTIR